MARKGNGSSAFILSAGIPHFNNYSMHFFFRDDHTPNTSAIRNAYSMSNAAVFADSTQDATFSWDHTFQAKTFYHRRASGGYDSVAIASSLSADTWYGLGVSYGSNVLNSYLNGALSATGAAADPVSSGGTPKVAALAGRYGSGDFTAGHLADLAIWDVVLTAVEWAALGAGVSPLLIRPQSLKIWWPFIGDANGPIGGVASVTGTTVTAHPRISIGTDQDFPGPFTEVHRTIESSLSFFDSLITPHPAFVEDTFESEVEFDSEFTDDAEDPPAFPLEDEVTFTSEFELGSLHLPIESDVRFLSRFRPITGALARGRFQGHLYGR